MDAADGARRRGYSLVTGHYSTVKIRNFEKNSRQATRFTTRRSGKWACFSRFGGKKAQLHSLRRAGDGCSGLASKSLLPKTSEEWGGRGAGGQWE